MFDGRDRELLNRAVVALEKLAEDPILEMEIGPPVCPHCNQFNPKVNYHPGDEDTAGRIFEFFVPFTCLNCQTEFWAVPTQWSMHKDLQTLAMEINGRAEAHGRLDKRQDQAAQA